jgi:hypothetical protein
VARLQLQLQLQLLPLQLLLLRCLFCLPVQQLLLQWPQQLQLLLLRQLSCLLLLLQPLSHAQAMQSRRRLTPLPHLAAAAAAILQ